MRRFAIAGVLGVLLGSAGWAATGEYWEMTHKMEMQGMSMPGMTTKVCVPKGAEKDPRYSSDKECEVTDVKTSGNRSSWAMRCTKNGETMTGTGEMTATPDRTDGVIKVTTREGKMTMGFVNKRVGGACDPEEMKKKVEAIQDAGNKQAAQQQAQVCDGYKTNLGRDVAAYFQLKTGAPGLAKQCGFNMAAAKLTLCKSVDVGNADFGKQIRGNSSNHIKSMQAECPREMKTYMEQSRKRYCEGRAFTEKQRQSLADCLKGSADDALHTPDPEEPPLPAGKNAADKSDADAGIKLPGGITLPSLPGGGSAPADAVIDGAKKLKNLFGL